MGESSAVTAVLDSMPMSAEHRKTDPAPERRLIRAARRGSEDAIEELVRNHWRGAYATALGIVGNPSAAEDIAQDAMLAAIRALGGFDRRRTFSPWLQRIVTNRALDSLRARQRRPEALIDGQSPIFATATPNDRFSDELIAALQRLDARDRAIVVLRHVAGFSSKEIGEIVEMPATAVRSALKRALERLRVDLSEEGAPAAIEHQEETR